MHYINWHWHWHSTAVTIDVVQAAYLVGTADPASEPGRPGLVDQSQFARANQAIQAACQSISNPASTPQQASCVIACCAKDRLSSLLCQRKSDNPGIVFPGHVSSAKKPSGKHFSGKHLSRKNTIPESYYPCNDCIPCRLMDGAFCRVCL